MASFGLFDIVSGVDCFLVGEGIVCKGKNNKRKIAQFLPSIMRQKGWEKQLDMHSVFERWGELVSEDAAEHARPVKIERGVLWLEVENSAWLSQLQYEKLEMLDSLNNSLVLGRFTDIKMILIKKGEVNPFARPAPGPDVYFETPDRQKIDSFRSQIEVIEDEGCRESGKSRCWR